MRGAWLLVGLVLLGGGPATGQLDLSPDGVGLYFDPEGSDNCLTVASGTVFSGYLLVTRPSDPDGIHGWELTLVVPPGLFLLQTIYSGQALNITSPPEYIVGLADPLPAADVIRLAEVQFLVIMIEPYDLFLQPVSRPTVPGQMIYASGGDEGVFVGLQPSSGAHDRPVAAINGDCPVPARPASWGRVKALYR
jgi:hypothetical protein